MIKLLRSEIRGLALFTYDELIIDFVAEKNVTEEEINRGNVEKLDGLVDKFNIVALVGSNATGKTTQLKLLKMMLGLFLSLNSTNDFKDLSDQFKDEVKFTNYFYNNKILYKVESYLRKDGVNSLSFEEEIVTSKRLYASHKKSDLFIFDKKDHRRGQKEIMRRSTLSEETRVFLRDDFSVFSTIAKNLNKKNSKYIIDEIEMTNSNSLNGHGELPSEYVKYFDSSIDSLEILSDSSVNKKKNVEITFKGRAPIQVPLIELNNYLSSGTIKGINLFVDIEETLRTGGYLIIDEIENHLHKSIVMNIIKLFSTNINSNGATLIFSTHYSEVIDILDRTDMVYISTKEENKVSIQKMSKLLGSEDRNDSKKSEILLSGKLDNTPTYKDFKQVRKRIKNKVSHSKNVYDRLGKDI